MDARTTATCAHIICTVLVLLLSVGSLRMLIACGLCPQGGAHLFCHKQLQLLPLRPGSTGGAMPGRSKQRFNQQRIKS